MVVAAVASQRLAELALSRRNERWLRGRGAIEYGARLHPVMVATHVCWLAGMLFERSGGRRTSRVAAVCFLAVQPLRLWVLHSLGRRWTTRVIVPTDPDEAAPVTTGPYRWMRHPNYAVVVVEIFALPWAIGARRTAFVGSAVNAAVLWSRRRTEDAALDAAAEGRSPVMSGQR